MSKFAILTPDEAASLIEHDQTIGFSGFTPAGAAKAVPRAIAKKAKAEHAAGRPFKIAVVTGASTGDSLDGELARANAIKWRTPYQTNKDLRDAINAGRTHFFDMHLSVLQQYVVYGFFGKFHWAVVEAVDVSDDGEIVLSSSIGASNTFLQVADKVIIELNSFHPPTLRGFHDIYYEQNPPHRHPNPLCKPSNRIGSPVVKIDPRKIVGIVRTHEPDESRAFTEADDVSERLGNNVADFLANELKSGRIPREFLPLQSGVGNVANALMAALGKHPGIPRFEMYSEVIQDSVVRLMQEDKLAFASGTSLTLSTDLLKEIYADIDRYRHRMVLRPQNISNSPELVRRLGVISINTALEADIFGNINSTHVLGKNMMNGIGGSGDFTRNAYISIFTCPSIAKGGKISTIVPMCSHIDHSEHSVQILVTEHGIADLRGKDPHERAMTIVNHCVHPEYQPILRSYFDSVADGQTPQTLGKAFSLHQAFLESGDMRKVKW